MDASEQARIAELHRYQLLDRPPDRELDAVVRIAAAVCGVPAAVLNLIDEDHQYQLSSTGFEGRQLPRAESMCAVRFLDGRTVWTPDASRHPDYRDNPWVNGTSAGIRCYASVPLVTPAGHVLGTLCVFDFATHELSEDQLRLLEDAAAVVVALFERRRQARINAELAAETERRRAVEEELRAAAEQGATFDASPLGMAVVAVDGTFVRVNPAFATVLGRAVGEVVGRNWRDVTHSDDLAPGERLDEETVTDPAAVLGLDKRFVRPDGRAVWVTLQITALPGDRGHRLAQAVDITDRVDAEHRARRETARLHATITAQRELLTAAADREQLLQVAADRTAAMFPAGSDVLVAVGGGAAPRVCTATPGLAGLLGMNVSAGADPRQQLTQWLTQRLALVPGVGSVIAAPLHTSGGAIAVTAPAAGAFDDTDERHLTVLAAALDSALLHAEDTARQSQLLQQANDAIDAKQRSEDQFRLTFDNSPLGLTLASVEPETFGQYLHANPAMTTITGYSAAELTAMTFRELQHPDDVGSTTAFTQQLVDGDRDTIAVERRYRHKHGHTIWVSVRVAIVRGADGRARYVVNQIEDITAGRAADEQLRRQAQLLDLAPAAIIVRDLDGTIRWWNDGAERLYGWPLDAAAGKPAQRLLCTAYRTGNADAQQSALLRDGRWEGHVEQITATGAAITTLSRQVLHRPNPDDPAQVLEVNSDVTAARTAQQALTDSEQRFRALFTNSAAGQVITALDGTVVDANPAYAALLGYHHEQLIGSTDRHVLHPDDVEENHHRVADLFAGDLDAYTGEVRLRHAGGHWIDVEATITLIRNSDGKPSHIIAVVTDITARRAAELARDAAEQLNRSLIDILSTGIVPPVAAIRDHADVLTGQLLDFEDARRAAADAIARQARQLADTVHEALTAAVSGAGRRR